MRPLILFAAISGRGDAWRRLGALGASGAAELVEALSPGQAEGAVAADAGHDPIIVAGGDGLVHEAINGLMRRPGPRPRLGILPLGTGNDIARNLGIRSVEAGQAAIDAGQGRAIDLLQIDLAGSAGVTTVYGGLNCGIGLGAAVVRATTPRVKRIFGPTMAYNVGTLRALLGWRSPQMVLRWDTGEYRGRVLFLSAGNAEWEGGGAMRLSPGAQIDDGRMWVTLVRHGPKLELLRNFGRLARGTHPEHPLVDYFRTTRLEVQCEPAVEAQSDGDVIGRSPLTITLVPQALEILAPPAAADG